jgi:hypothetical protein
MQDELFFNTEFSPTGILDKLYQEASVEENYYWSPAVPPVMRCDVSKEIRDYFKRLINAPFNDCGFLKTYPNSIYPIHKDTFRITALNMTLMDDNPDFTTQVVGVKLGTVYKYPVTYVKDEFTILNVSQLHNVTNKSQSFTRTILSIGFKECDYATLLRLHLEGKLFNDLSKQHLNLLTNDI